jgi:hypothetical protein
MADLSKLSDQELDAMIAKRSQPAATPKLADLSDDDLDRMIAEKQGSPSLPEPKRHTKGDSALMAGIQGASAGFLDEISGAGEAIGRAVGVKGIGGKFSDVELADDGPTLDWQTLRDAYIQARDKKRTLLADQAKEYPAETTAASIAGAIVSPVNKIAKGASLAKGGAAIGGVTALGNSDADNAKDLLIDTATGTVTGLVLGKGAEKAGKLVDKGVQKVGEKSKAAAEWLAARALGLERNTIKSQGAANVRAAGRQALDEGVLSPFANTDDLINRNDAVRKAGGKLMGEAYEAIDEAGASTFSPTRVGDKVNKELSPTFRTPINKAETAQLDNTIETILARGEKNIPLREAQALKKEIGEVAFPKGRRPPDPSPKQQMAIDAYEIVNKSIDEAVDRGSQIIEKAGLTEKLRRGKALYGRAETANKLLENKLAREQGNRIVGLTDAFVGTSSLGYGLGTGDWETSVGIMAGKKYLEKYGAQQAALALNKLSKGLLKAPAMAELAKKSPPLFVSIAQKLEGKAVGAAAENDLQPELKGKDKWVSEGFSKLMEHNPKLSKDPEAVAKMISNNKSRELLMRASDLKPGSKAFEKISAQLAKGDS